ncbi:MAG: DUF58 domain-containing protein [Ornithinimicrobium sp.]
MTHAHARAFLVGGFGLVAAVLLRRPDLIVLVVPFAVVAGWGLLTRPRDVPQARLRQSHLMIREGDTAYLAMEVTPVSGQDLTAGSVATSVYVEAPGGRNARVTATPQAGATLIASVPLRATRWGRRRLGPVVIGGSSSWGAFRYGPVPLEALAVTVVPQPAVFDSSGPAPSPRGLIGRHRSTRPGEGSEFATIRPFQWGDRLKRIHWARSLRSGELHVATTYADQDTHVAVVLDAHYDLGRSEGVDGRPSSLDQSVRAAAAVSEHFLHHGDRVSLRVLSHRAPMSVPPGAGRRHGVRILDTLARVVPGPPMNSRAPTLGLRPGALVVVVSAMVSPDAATSAARLAGAGFSVVMIDTLQDRVQPEDDEKLALLAWRLRMIEREHEIAQIIRRGVPVVPWVGPGSLDGVLRQMGRQRR